MAKKIYLTGIEPSSGKSFVAVGILKALQSIAENLQAFKLFSESKDEENILLETLTHQSITPLMPILDGMKKIQETPKFFFREIFEYVENTTNSDFLWFEGTDFECHNSLLEYGFNLRIAGELDCDVMLMVSAKTRTLSEIISLIKGAYDIAKKNYVRVTAIIINRVEKLHEDTWQKKLTKTFQEQFSIIIIPEFSSLSYPSMGEISKKLNAHILCGKAELNREVRQITIAAKTLEGFLTSRQDRENMLIVTPCDRVDILLGSLLADQSLSYPKIAGIVLTGDEELTPAIMEIVSGLEHPFPVLLTKTRTYETATTLYTAKYSLHIDNMNKVNQAIHLLKPILLPPLLTLVEKQITPTLNPTLFLHHVVQRVKQKKQHIILPEGEDLRILQATDELLRRGLVDITLLGCPKKIERLAKKNNLNLKDATLIHPENSPLKSSLAKDYFKLRQHKNVNLPIALERLSDPNYFATMMVFQHLASGVVSGAEHTTADTVRPALEIIKTKPGVSRVSSIFIMCLPTRVLIYGDCAINPEPDSALLSEIGFEAAKMAQNLGLQPKVAFLSYSSGTSGKGQSVEKIHKAVSHFKKNHPDILAEGPIQYDAAVDPTVSQKKMPHSAIKGEANVLIFPDLNTGNNTYKAVQRETQALAIGPILLGLNQPINDLSRGCTTEDIINTILITAIQAGDTDENSHLKCR